VHPASGDRSGSRRYGEKTRFIAASDDRHRISASATMVLPTLTSAPFFLEVVGPMAPKYAFGESEDDHGSQDRRR
jgi:hypothetical protein